MSRLTSFVVAALLLVLLLASVFLQVWVLSQQIELTTTRFPETESLAMPGLVWGVIAIACCQAIVLIGLRLVILSRKDEFVDYAFGWLRAIVGCLLAFIVLVAVAFTALTVLGYSSPAQPELVVLGIVALIATGLLLASPTTRRPWSREA